MLICTVLAQVQDETPKSTENGHQTEEAAPEGIVCHGVLMNCTVVHLCFDLYNVLFDCTRK